MENLKRLHRCCFTGHRPEKLNVSDKVAKRLLRIAIHEAIQDGFTTFISGMARGIDMWAAEIIIKERKKNADIKLICVVPFKGFEKSWSFTDRCRYNFILKKSDYIKFVCEKYSPNCFRIRNCYMVDHSSRVIAGYNGAYGGTRNTVRYAISKHIKVINILDSNLQKCRLSVSPL